MTDRTTGKIYYAAHPEVVTSHSLLERIGRAVGRRVRVLSVPTPIWRAALWMTETGARWTGRATMLTRDKGNELFQPAWICDPTPLAADAGWQAAHDLEAGARKTVQWYRERGWL